MKKRALILSLIILGLSSGICTAQNSILHSHVASFWDKVKDKVVQCQLCPRKCVLSNNQRGICTARINRNGVLYTLAYGNPISLQVDPIEKKPFFHVSPGADVFSLAVAGCNMRCLFCQNWQISQAKPDEAMSYRMSPEEIISTTQKKKCRFIAYTYTEPTIFYEYMSDIAILAKEKGIYNTMHTCGYINKEPLVKLLKIMYAVNVDLKSFDDGFYQKMGMMASLEPVLETLKTIKQQGVWLEITNLLIPGQNDDPNEIKKMCVWIKENLGSDVPLHFSRFYPAFRLANLPPTPVEKLEEAYKIAIDAGLRYVYIGNMPGNPQEDTYCPNCKKMVVSRTGYKINAVDIVDGKCKFCGYKIAGLW